MSEPDDDPIELDGIIYRADWELLFPRTDEDWEKMFAALQAAKGKLPKPRKPRKPSITKVIEQAEKVTGKPVTAVTMPDGTRLDFSKAPNATADDEVENWLGKQKGH
jgi:hypothetical protein